MLQIRLLGQFDVRADGKRVSIPSRAGQSLFAYLVLTSGTMHRREKLAGLFWPDMPDDSARHHLRQELWRIRKALTSQAVPNTKYLLAEDLTIAFNPQAEFWLDAAQLERQGYGDASSAELVSQLELYRGELLPGFYDDWVVLERERYQAVYESKMEQFLRLLIQERRWTTTVEWGERWIALGQAPEPAYRALMLAHASLGNRTQAVAAFERCREALEKEFGVEPAPETCALHEEILQTDRGGLKEETSALLQLAAPHPPPSALFAPSPDAPPAPGEPPFKGMEYFDEGDADLFFGREQLTARLLQRLSQNRFLAVIVGASGSGKSSIVRAGLVPAFKKESEENEWGVYLITPSAHPLEALARALTREEESVTATATLLDDFVQDPRSLYLYLQRKIEGGPRKTEEILSSPILRPSSHQVRHLLLVIDQFEELFTLCHDELEQEQFVDNLLTAVAPDSNGLVTLILAIRADFYAHLAQFPELRDAVAQHQEYIGPMTTEELRRAIEEPARRGGWEFEPGLVDLMLRDVGDQPGALPLLSHALLETWKRRRGRMMMLQGYADAGGVRGAIAQTAETIYGQLTSEQQTIARNIFLRLTALGEGTEDTRRRASLDEFLTKTEDADLVRLVLDRLVDARLVTSGEQGVEVAHEALIHEWPALREWLTRDREGLRVHQRLTEAAHDWDLLERDTGGLYRGARLAQALEFTQTHPGALNEQERAFLGASGAAERRELAEKEEQRQRELDSARRIAETAQQLAEEQRQRAEEHARAAKSLRRRAYFLASAFLLAIVLAGVALFSGEQAQANASIAEKAKSEADAQRLAAESERRTAFSRELAAVAINNLNSDSQQSLLLALEAVSTTYSADKTWTTEAENALHQAVQAVRVPLTLSVHASSIFDMVLSRDGKHVAAMSEDDMRVWDATNGEEKFKVTVPGQSYFTDLLWGSLALGPDGLGLAVLDADDPQTVLVKVWDWRSDKLVHTATMDITPGEITTYALSPDLSRVATSEVDGTAKVWDMATGQLLLTLLGERATYGVLAFSPDGTRLATVGSDNTVGLWDLKTGKLGERISAALTATSGALSGAAFSPDGKRLALGCDDGTTSVWDLATGTRLYSVPVRTGQIHAVAFSPDGASLAVGSADTRVSVWDASNAKQLLTLVGHTGNVNAVAFGPDGQRLATASGDGTVKIWNLAPSGEALRVATDPILAFAASADGRRFATSHPDNTARVWDAATGKTLLTLSGHTSPVRAIAFSRDGTRLATGSSDRTAKLWDLTTGKEVVTLSGHTDGVNGVDFSPDGTRVATASADTRVKIWDTTTGRELLTISGFAGPVNSVAFSADGTRLATAHSNSPHSQVKVWDATTGKLLGYQSGHASAVWDAQFSPDGKRIVSAGEDATARLIDATTVRGLFILYGHTSSVAHATFNADSTRIATASDDGTVKLWVAATGQELLTLYGQTGPLNGVAFSPDGDRLITSSEDGTVQMYLMRIEDLVQLARSRLTRTWTLAECRKFLHVDQCP